MYRPFIQTSSPMDFPRAQNYQARIDQYFTVALRSRAPTSAETLTQTPNCSPTPALLSYRHFTRGDGLSGHPIDVERWTNLQPLDVDAFVPDRISVDSFELESIASDTMGPQLARDDNIESPEGGVEPGDPIQEGESAGDIENVDAIEDFAVVLASSTSCIYPHPPDLSLEQ